MSDNLNHIGIIPDGNRRFAKRLKEKPWKGHEWGSEKLENVIRWLSDSDVGKITIYSLSWENLHKRPEAEFDFLMELFKRKALEKARSEKVQKEGIKFRVIGNLDNLPEEVVDAFDELEENTKDNENITINLAVAYSGRQELVSAFKQVEEKEQEINEENIEENLWIDSDYPELIIRTGGEKRLSNFLIWQAAYSELYFIEKMWPEIGKEDIQKAVEDFEERERRFGK